MVSFRRVGSRSLPIAVATLIELWEPPVHADASESLTPAQVSLWVTVGSSQLRLAKRDCNVHAGGWLRGPSVGSSPPGNGLPFSTVVSAVTRNQPDPGPSWAL